MKLFYFVSVLFCSTVLIAKPQPWQDAEHNRHAAPRGWPWWKTQQDRIGGKRVPYYAEFRNGGQILVFRGYVLLENEPRIKLMQTHYLENLDNPEIREYFRVELQFLGVHIEVVPDNPALPSENIQHHYPPTQSVH